MAALSLTLLMPSQCRPLSSLFRGRGEGIARARNGVVLVFPGVPCLRFDTSSVAKRPAFWTSAAYPPSIAVSALYKRAGVQRAFPDYIHHAPASNKALRVFDKHILG